MTFPDVPFRTAAAYFDGYTQEFGRAAKSVDTGAIDRAAAILLDSAARGSRLFACGNGGSAAIANHLQCDHMKGVRNATDLRPRVLSLSANVALLSAIANDLGYQEVFRYQLECQSEPGDVLIAVSSSGRSASIVRAIGWAREHQLRTIAITGFEGGPARRDAEVAIHVDCANYGIVEDLHQAVMHVLAQYLRQSRMTADVISGTVF